MAQVHVEGNGVPLNRLVEALGPAVVRVLSTAGLATVFAREVILYDPVDPPSLRAGDLVLAVGVRAVPEDANSLLVAAGLASAAAVVVKSSDADLALLREAASGAGITLMVIPTAMRWEQISLLLRHVITAAHSNSSSLTTVGDLFGLANVLAKAVGGAITIEDATSHVLAYSTIDADEIDQPRREAILGRRVPNAYLHHLREVGVLDALRISDRVVELKAHTPLGLRRRLAIAVRADTEVLGTLWALEGKKPLGPEAERALRDAAPVASAHLLREQISGLTLQQHRDDTLQQLLEGRVEVGSAASTLGFDPGLPAAVIGVALEHTGTPSAARHAHLRLHEIISSRAMAFRWHVSSSLAGARVLALLPELTGDAEQVRLGIRRFAGGVASDAHQAGLTVRVACGPVMPSMRHIAASTASVDEILVCLAREPDRGPIAGVEDVRAWVSVNQVLDALAPMSNLWDGPVARVLEYDAEHGSGYGPTLRAWLDGFGDSAAVADALGIHRNTLRYRIRRISELSGLRLDDPEERLIAALHLRRL